jgi:hypothetical protein
MTERIWGWSRHCACHPISSCSSTSLLVCFFILLLQSGMANLFASTWALPVSLFSDPRQPSRKDNHNASTRMKQARTGCPSKKRFSEDELLYMRCQRMNWNSLKKDTRIMYMRTSPCDLDLVLQCSSSLAILNPSINTFHHITRAGNKCQAFGREISATGTEVDWHFR